MTHRQVIVLLLAVLSGVLLARPLPAWAGDGTPTCTGYIDAAPAVIKQPGTWCLRHDVVAKPLGPATVAAIFIDAHDVTLDCQGHRLTFRSPFQRNHMLGIAALRRSNITVRDCRLDGIWLGIVLSQGRANTIEDNLIQHSGNAAISLTGHGSVISRNRVLDTGWTSESSATAIGAAGSVDILDNLVSGVAALPPPGNGTAMFLGISAVENTGTIAHNRVYATSGPRMRIYGIFGPWVTAFPSNIHHNDVIGHSGEANGVGIMCLTSSALVTDNRINGFPTAVGPLCTSSNNHVAP